MSSVQSEVCSCLKCVSEIFNISLYNLKTIYIYEKSFTISITAETFGTPPHQEI